MNAINARALECGRLALLPGAIAERLPKFAFVTISGAHLYGFHPRIQTSICAEATCCRSPI